jgi:glucuronate isomerase
MRPFIHENFLLNNKTAERLFHNYSENQPLIDFHCHLSPALISGDHNFENLTQAWLEGDHYKWRAMRSNGINERYCTGNASAFAKFEQWADTVPATIGNPLYHWTHLELARYFNIFELLSASSSKQIFDKATEMLQTPEFSIRSLLRKMNVEIICTTDDPADSLEHHAKIKDNLEIKVLPTFRPDNILKTNDPQKFKEYILKLGKASGTEISSFISLLESIEKRHKFFHESGCRISDHGLERFCFSEFSTAEIERIFKKLLNSESISNDEAEKYKTAIMLEICRMNYKRGWVHY